MDIEDRLRDLADSAGPWSDPSSAVLRTARARRNRIKVTAVAAAVVAVLGGGITGIVVSGPGAGSSMNESSGSGGAGSDRAAPGAPQAAPSSAICRPLPIPPGGSSSFQPGFSVNHERDGRITIHLNSSGTTVRRLVVAFQRNGRTLGTFAQPFYGTSGSGGGSFTARPVTCAGAPLAPGRYGLVVALNGEIIGVSPVIVH